MKRYPIILIEGLDGVGKTTLTRLLSSELGAELITCPPRLADHDVLGPLRSHFDGRPEAVRRAYYRFANLLASEHALAVSVTRPVVLDRYWPSTVAFGVGVDRSAELETWVGRYPPELMRPDIMVLLEVDEPTRARRMGHRGEPATEEEATLARASSLREAVSRVYRAFHPVVVDTSPHDEAGVLGLVRAILVR